MNNILDIKGICKAYPQFSLQDVSFSLPEGAIMGFIGENGAGKTTTIKAILGLIQLDQGEVDMFGLNMKMKGKQNKEDIGVVLSECYFPENMNAGQISKVLKGMHKKWDEALFQKYLHDFNLVSNKKIKEFSKGMKMKLAIACALAHHPKLLILDEATSGLDPVVRDEILDVFLEFIQDEHHSVLLSSHITSDIEKAADYITFIHEGKILMSEEKDLLLENCAIMKIDEAVFKKLSAADMIAYRNNGYAYEVLIKDRYEMKKRFPKEVFDRATLEDIMLFTIKGAKL